MAGRFASCCKDSVLHLKEQTAVGLQADALAIGQCQQPVVIHDTVHVLHPHSIHITIKHQVLGLILHPESSEHQVTMVCIPLAEDDSEQHLTCVGSGLVLNPCTRTSISVWNSECTSNNKAAEDTHVREQTAAMHLLCYVVIATVLCVSSHLASW